MNEELNVFRNYDYLTCENQEKALFYKKKDFKICDTTNINIFWNFDEVNYF